MTATSIYEYRATITNVVDGDTVDATIQLGFRMSSVQRLRLLGLDTPEKFGPTKVQGLAAKQFVMTNLLGKTVVIRTHKSDVFGRWLAVIYLDGVDFNQRLIDEGWAVLMNAIARAQNP